MIDRDTLRALGLAAEIGFAIAVPIVAGSYLGSWADRQLGTEPLFLLVGVLLGMFAGFYTIYQLMRFRRGDNQPPTGRDTTGR